MKLIFKGIVQGVGFRPTVYRIAKKLGLKGYVLNKGSEVEVVINKNKKQFLNQLRKQLPSIAEISEIIEKPDDRKFDDFKIVYSENGRRQSLIPVDTAICEKCTEELFDSDNRRYLYPFTNCTICGARFSLIEDVPYDRERTSMESFPLCEKCMEEYTNPADRRYHAQTISCPNCGPQYTLYDKQKNMVEESNSIKRCADEIDKGKIGVIKSWGGMHLCCKISEVEKFRDWYNRPQKAFAIMVRNIETAQKYGKINDYERELLLSDSKPVLLVKKKISKKISPGLNTIGLFLPYSGIHHLLFHYLDTDSIILTSANRPGEPMMTDNDEVFALNADFYLLHNRKILNRVDDSVIKTWRKNRFFLRKSRGFVPKPLKINYDENILSVGAEENVIGAFSANKKMYLTQYIGNSKYYPTLNFLEDSLNHIMNMVMEKPKIDAVAMDLHPTYDTREVAKKLSEKFSADTYEIQHHWAHATSLLFDNGLNEGVILTLDGLGYGSDGKFWGGEILSADFNSFERVGHLQYIPLLGGDQATRNPKRLVYAIFKKFGKEKYFKDKKADVLSKLMDNSPLTSSIGRILDVLSCYLNICQKRTYDGEPAMKLEKYLALGENKYSFDLDINEEVIKTVDLFGQLDEKISSVDELSKKQKADLSYSFVKIIMDGMIDLAIQEAEKKDISYIGLTGGVSYNIPITEMVMHRVKKAGFEFVVHDRIPNGDGGISAGQNVIVGHKIS